MGMVSNLFPSRRSASKPDDHDLTLIDTLRSSHQPDDHGLTSTEISRSSHHCCCSGDCRLLDRLSAARETEGCLEDRRLLEDHAWRLDFDSSTMLRQRDCVEWLAKEIAKRCGHELPCGLLVDKLGICLLASVDPRGWQTHDRL